MKLIVRHRGRERSVVIENAPEGYFVTVDERRYEVDSAATGKAVRSLLINGRQTEVGLHRRRNGHYEVTSRGGREDVEVLEPLTLLAEKTHGKSDDHGVTTVDAYMPGRVVELLVEEGQRVETGQGVLVLEAMKMENEIQAGRPGIVSRIFVRRGEPVEGGDALYEIS
ncbi:MAG: biotin/lipoyl-binding protein [Acidobacteriota bacterium]|nr:biotin/lipoyl-binding protein [Acidobacteriota bacterium]